MHLSTIEMDRGEAEAALAEWAAQVKTRHTDEDAAIAEGYALLAQGKSLLLLSETIRAGGEDELHRPRLAVAPVTSGTIYLHRLQSGDARFCVRPNPGRWGLDVGPAGVYIHDAFPSIDWKAHRELTHWDGSCLWQAMVPVVPPRFRARGWRGAHVLFEAEWARRTPPAPIDPALIKHLRGDLWVVLGTWDLTPLERAVLMERNLGE